MWEEIEQVEDVYERARIARDKVREESAEEGMYAMLRKKNPVRTRVLSGLLPHIRVGRAVIQAFEELKQTAEA